MKKSYNSYNTFKICIKYIRVIFHTLSFEIQIEGELYMNILTVIRSRFLWLRHRTVRQHMKDKRT